MGIQIPLTGRGNFEEGGRRPIVNYREALPYVSCAKTAAPIEMPFRIGTRVGPRNHVCHLLNTIKLSMCGADAAFCQITLTTRYC